jgi:hypothetical protein
VKSTIENWEKFAGLVVVMVLNPHKADNEVSKPDE